MKNTAACAKKFRSLLKKLEAGPEPVPAGKGDPVSTLIYSCLLWEATVTDADAAFQSIIKGVVDFNELRVLLPHDMIEIMGEEYPHADERSRRLRAILRDIYVRAHEVSLSDVDELGKRDTKVYLESLEGMVPFVSSRLQLLHYEGKLVPVDEQLRGLLIDEGAVDQSASVTEITNWIGRQLKSGEELEVAGKLQAWSDQEIQKQRRNAARRVSRKKPVRTTKKTASKKTTTKKASTTTRSRKKTTGRKAAH